MKASYMGLVLVTICLMSIASFVFLSTPRGILTSVREHMLRGDKPTSDRYKELQAYVQKLEAAVAQTSQNEKKTSTSEEHGGDAHEAHMEDHMAAYKAPDFDPNHKAPSAEVNVPNVQSEVKATLDDKVTSQWLSSLASKLLCLRLKSGGIYLYHTRKAAGTSIRDILATIAATWHVPYYETEGVVLNRDIVDKKNGLLTVTSLRDPVSRILSLYWYEHVGWYDGVLKQTERCKSLKQWVSAWRDGSHWKMEFMAKNPDSVYVEIDNYYVKMLSGWHGKNSRSRVTEEDLNAAKEVLRSFDLVLLSDWMGDSTQIEALNAIFPGRTNIAAGHKVKGDHNAKVRLAPMLAPDEVEIREVLTEMNKFDIELFEYAQTLMAYRLKFIAPTVLSVKQQLGMDSHLDTVVSSAVFAEHKDQCAALDSTLTPEFKKKYVGIFQPPGHKGPF